MKLLVIFVLLISVFSVQAEDRRYQNLYRAEKNKFLVEGGYEFINFQGESSSNDNVDFSYTYTNLRLEYGLRDDLALGIEGVYQVFSDSEGMGDYQYFLRGQYRQFFYEFRYYHSYEEQTDDNTVSGGNHYSIELGYALNGYGARYFYLPAYDYEFEDDNTDYENRGSNIFEVFYEHLRNDQTYGIALVRNEFVGTEEDGEELSESSIYFGTRLYAAIPLMGVDFLPTISYNNLVSDNNSFDELYFTNLELKVRYEF